MAHPDRLVAVDAGEERVVGRDAQGGRPVLAPGSRQHVPAELEGHQLGAVADAEDRDPAGPDRRVRLRGIRVVHGVRAAGQDDRRRATPFEVGQRRVVREELGVDVQLPDAAGDQLGELAPEVEDDHRAVIRGGRPVGGCALGGRCVERRLEVRLDLGVVRGEDAMAGVRRLAVDRLALARHPRRRPPCRRGPAVPEVYRPGVRQRA